MPTVRDYEARDLDALYTIATATGDGGADAAALFVDPLLIGHVYAAPYAILEPRLALVVEDEVGTAGYCVGALHTHEFEERLERECWPTLRIRYPLATGTALSEPSTQDAAVIQLLHRPPRTPAWLTQLYPSHLHINLLPRLQGQGIGRLLLSAWRERARDLGSTGFHLGVSPANARAIRFYEAAGLTRLSSPHVSEHDDGTWFGAGTPTRG